MRGGGCTNVLYLQALIPYPALTYLSSLALTLFAWRSVYTPSVHCIYMAVTYFNYLAIRSLPGTHFTVLTWRPVTFLIGVCFTYLFTHFAFMTFTSLTSFTLLTWRSHIPFIWCSTFLLAAHSPNFPCTHPA